MKLKKETTLRDGEPLVLRSLRSSDAQEMLALCTKTAGETLNMMRYADEWTITTEKQAEILRSAENDAGSLMLGAFVHGRLAGACSLRPVHPADRARHRAGLGVCVLKAYWGRGIGTAMMQAAIDAAQTTALEQLELDVVSTNESAIRLYRRFGFAEFGRHPRMMKYRDGTYADAILMALDLRAQK